MPATRDRACGVAVWRAPGATLLHARTLALPARPGLHRRAAAIATLVVEDLTVTVASTHLDLDAAARLDSATRVRAALDEAALPGHTSDVNDGSGRPPLGGAPGAHLVLAADVNEQPGGPAWERLGAGLLDARDGLGPTFPARAAQRHIDGLWVSPGLRVVSASVVTEAGTASDHLPLLVELAALA